MKNPETPVSESISISARPGRYLSFSLGAQEYAIPLPIVKEVIALPDITPVPSSASHILGIINLRGMIISIVDLALKLKIKDLKRGPETAVIILDVGAKDIGMVVTSVNSVLPLGEGEISLRPGLDSGSPLDVIPAVAKREDRLTLLLDLSTLLKPEDFTGARNAAPAAA